MEDCINVLVVEDNPGDAELIKEYFSFVNGETYHVYWEDKLSSALAYLNSGERVDLALVDLGLPDSVGTNAISSILQSTPNLPVVVITGNTDKKVALKAIKAGAQDYLIKGEITSEALRRVCQYARERQQYSKAIRKSEQFLRSSLDSLTAHIAILSENGDINAVNQAWRDFAAENNALSPVAYLHENYLKVCMEAEGEGAEEARLFADGLREVMRGDKTIYKMDYDCHGPSQKKWFHCRVTPFPGDEWKGFTVVAHQDITERKNAEIALRENQKKYQFLTENTVDCIWQMDLQGNLIYVNQAAEHFFGYKPSKLIGENLRNYCSEKQYSKIQERMAETLSIFPGTQKDSFETEFIHRSSKTIPVQISNKVITDDAGIPSGIQGVTRDISAQIKAEKERKRLQDLVTQSQKMESLGTLAGGIAHDFNNILTAILGFAELCKFGGRDNPTFEEDLTEIYNAGVRAKELVGQILTFSRQAETEIQPLMLQLIIKEACKLLRATIPANIEILQEYETDVSQVIADPTQIHQVIMNLCTNAAHAMQKTGGVLKISLKEKEVLRDKYSNIPVLEPGKYVELEITDNGGGIPKEIQPLIFDPYFTTKDIGEGTGLGLAVVHGIINDCGGNITLQSEPDKGTTFTILLPAAPSKTDKSMVEPTELSSPRGNETILVVDDEAVILKVVERVLSKNGYKVITENESQKALELFKDDPYGFDLVLSDITMPGLTGDKLATHILAVRKDIPVILMTGYSHLLREDNTDKLGFDVIILKPISKAVLLHKVRTSLDSVKQSNRVNSRAE